MLTFAYRDGGLVRHQLPLATGAESEPEPDIAVVPERSYLDHPTTAWLVVEVSDSSRARDLQVKAPFYTAAGIDPYWVVDLQHEHVVVHRGPSYGGYDLIERKKAGERLALPRVPEEVAVDDLLRWGTD